MGLFNADEADYRCTSDGCLLCDDEASVLYRFVTVTLHHKPKLEIDTCGKKRREDTPEYQDRKKRFTQQAPHCDQLLI